MLPPKVTCVEALPEYQLNLRFADGYSGTLDMKPYLDFGIFARLRDPDTFALACIRFDTVEWPCGVDLDPAFISSGGF